MVQLVGMQNTAVNPTPKQGRSGSAPRVMATGLRGMGQSKPYNGDKRLACIS
jgi:hypothetical protein